MIDFVLANSADPHESLHYATFHLALHCLKNNPFKDSRSYDKPDLSFKSNEVITFRAKVTS